ncbi:BAR domain-containing protein, partial [Durusdinium trenchii]
MATPRDAGIVSWVVANMPSSSVLMVVQSGLSHRVSMMEAVKDQVKAKQIVVLFGVATYSVAFPRGELNPVYTKFGAILMSRLPRDEAALGVTHLQALEAAGVPVVYRDATYAVNWLFGELVWRTFDYYAALCEAPCSLYEFLCADAHHRLVFAGLIGEILSLLSSNEVAAIETPASPLGLGPRAAVLLLRAPDPWFRPLLYLCVALSLTGWPPRLHGNPYGDNPEALADAATVLGDVLERARLVERPVPAHALLADKCHRRKLGFTPGELATLAPPRPLSHAAVLAICGALAALCLLMPWLAWQAFLLLFHWTDAVKGRERCAERAGGAKLSPRQRRLAQRGARETAEELNCQWDSGSEGARRPRQAARRGRVGQTKRKRTRCGRAREGLVATAAVVAGNCERAGEEEEEARKGFGRMLSKSKAVDSLKKTKRRTTEKILQKLGQSEQTQEDLDFNELHGEFSDTQKQMVVLLSKMQLYAESLAKWQRCGEALTKELSVFVAAGKDASCESREGLEEMAMRFTEAQTEISSVCNNLADKWTLQILNPLRDVTFTFNEQVKEKVAQRAEDKVDFDVYRRRAKHLTEGGTQAQKNFNKLALTQSRYENNTKFLTQEFTRMRESRSDLIIDEVTLAVHFQVEFMKSVHNVLGERMGDLVQPNLPEGASGFGKRNNRWIENGSVESRKMAGYFQGAAERANEKRKEQERATNARHYARNAPRGKQVFLKNIGKQLSLSNLERRSVDSNAPGKEGGYVLPETSADDSQPLPKGVTLQALASDVSSPKNDGELSFQAPSMVSYKMPTPIEAPVTPINIGERSSDEAYGLSNVHESDEGDDEACVSDSSSRSHLQQQQQQQQQREQEAEEARLLNSAQSCGASGVESGQEADDEEVDRDSGASGSGSEGVPQLIDVSRFNSERTIRSNDPGEDEYESDFEEVEEDLAPAVVEEEEEEDLGNQAHTLNEDTSATAQKMQVYDIDTVLEQHADA